MPRVLNRPKHGVPTSAIYIGRLSIWGNSFVIGKDGTRDEVVAKFEACIRSKPDLLAQLPKLAGRDVVCCQDWPTEGPADHSISRSERGLRPNFIACRKADQGASSPRRSRCIKRLGFAIVPP